MPAWRCGTKRSFCGLWPVDLRWSFSVMAAVRRAFSQRNLALAAEGSSSERAFEITICDI